MLKQSGNNLDYLSFLFYNINIMLFVFFTDCWLHGCDQGKKNFKGFLIHLGWREILTIISIPQQVLLQDFLLTPSIHAWKSMQVSLNSYKNEKELRSLDMLQSYCTSLHKYQTEVKRILLYVKSRECKEKEGTNMHYRRKCSHPFLFCLYIMYTQPVTIQRAVKKKICVGKGKCSK